MYISHKIQYSVLDCYLCTDVYRSENQMEEYMSNTGNWSLRFGSDYQEGAHPEVLRRLVETNMVQTPGYGDDAYSEAARNKIRALCEAPDADVWFLVGGTQTNATMIDAFLRPYQGVISADTGHINEHEAGAVEFGGHKILTLPHKNGRISAAQIRAYLREFWGDENHEHMVMPGMVYVSHPTEFGTLYTRQELQDIHDVCREYEIPLYLDGARLAYALACPQNDVTLPDLARLCDAFYIGGTKCGALFGEAVVIPQGGRIPHMISIIKQHGALLAKGRLTGLQFDALFTDGLYFRLGKPAVEAADRLRKALAEKGYVLRMESPANMLFVSMTKEQHDRLAAHTALEFHDCGAGTFQTRIVTSWATEPGEVDALTALL